MKMARAPEKSQGYGRHHVCDGYSLAGIYGLRLTSDSRTLVCKLVYKKSEIKIINSHNYNKLQKAHFVENQSKNYDQTINNYTCLFSVIKVNV